MANKTLTKGPDAKLAGVCSGVAEFVGWSARSVRIAWVLGTILSAGFGGVVAYVLMAFAMPKQDGFDLRDYRVQ